jgi:hypothetical protein
MAGRSGITIFPFRRYRYPSDPMLDILKFLRPRKPETPDSSTQLLLPVEINGKWGYIDARGELAIDAQFDSVGSFEEGRAAVEVDYDYGFIDSSGSIVVPPQYEEVGDFSEGLAEICLDGRWGFIDAQGELRLEPQYGMVTPFKESLAAVSVGLGSGHYFINSEGGQVIDGKFDALHPFREGKASASLNGNWGYIDKTGAWFIRPCFEHADAFSEGRASFGVFHNGHRIWNYVSADKEYIFATIEDCPMAADPFSEGLAFVRRQHDYKHGFLDSSGELVLPAKYEASSGSYFKDGLAPVRVGQKYGVIDRRGEFVVAPKFAQLFYKGEGIFAEVGGAYINKGGNYIWQP